MFYSATEFAKKIGVSVYSLKNWEKSGKLLPHHKTPGGKRMYTDEQVAEFLGTPLNKSITLSFKDGKLAADVFDSLSFEELGEVIRTATQARKVLLEREGL